MSKSLSSLVRGRVAVLSTGLLCVLGASAARGSLVPASLPVGPITFENATDYADNFREYYDNGDRLGQTTNGAANDYLAQTAGTSNDNGIAVYDTTAADGTTTQHVFSSPFQVQFDARAAQATSSVGVFLMDPTNEGNNILALLNIDANVTSDRIRFFRDAPLASNKTGPGTQVNITSSSGGTVTGGNQFDGESGVNVNQFGAFVLTYSLSGADATVSLMFGNISATAVYTGQGIATPEIALRMFDVNTTAGTTDVDNFSVVPEPGAAGVIALMAMGGLARRRRRRS